MKWNNVHEGTPPNVNWRNRNEGMTLCRRPSVRELRHVSSHAGTKDTRMAHYSCVQTPNWGGYFYKNVNSVSDESKGWGRRYCALILVSYSGYTTPFFHTRQRVSWVIIYSLQYLNTFSVQNDQEQSAAACNGRETNSKHVFFCPELSFF